MENTWNPMYVHTCPLLGQVTNIKVTIAAHDETLVICLYYCKHKPAAFEESEDSGSWLQLT